MNQNISSTLPSNRILSIDTLRGVAVLGILIMNIQSFSMIDAAYSNPTAYGDFTGFNRWIWTLSHLFADSKFMSIFSMLFGAGIVLFWERAVSKGKKAGALHYRRTRWLLVFGLIHAYLIWRGDILVAYSLCAFFVFIFRERKPKTLFILGAVLFVIPAILFIGSSLSYPYWPEENVADLLKGWRPDADRIAAYHEVMRGNWIGQLSERVHSAIMLQTSVFFMIFFWRISGLMLIGMALYKTGFIAAQKTRKAYLTTLFVGLPVGLLLAIMGVVTISQKDWAPEYAMFVGYIFNYVGSLGIAFAYIAMIMLIFQSNGWQWFKRTFSAVGKMAFTNYILTSLICTFIFYGHGLGLIGQVERGGQLLVVLGVWAIIMTISPLWLKRFKYGPLEWLWRYLTYLRRP